MSEQLVERLVTAIRDEDLDAFGGLYRGDAVMHEPMLGEPARGREQIVAGEAVLFDAFSDVSVDVHWTFASAGRVVAEVTMAATNDGPLDLGMGEPLPATGRRIDVPMVWVLEVGDDGLIVEERDYFDTAVIMRQLGLDESG